MWLGVCYFALNLNERIALERIFLRQKLEQSDPCSPYIDLLTLEDFACGPVETLRSHEAPCAHLSFDYVSLTLLLCEELTYSEVAQHEASVLVYHHIFRF